MDKRDVVHVPRHVRQHRGDLFPALARRHKRPGRPHQIPVFALERHLRLRARHRGAVELLQLRFVVPEIDVRGGAGAENLQDLLGFRPGREQRILRRRRHAPIQAQEPREGDPGEAGGHLIQKMPPVEVENARRVHRRWGGVNRLAALKKEPALRCLPAQCSFSFADGYASGFKACDYRLKPSPKTPRVPAPPRAGKHGVSDDGGGVLSRRCARLLLGIPGAQARIFTPGPHPEPGRIGRLSEDTLQREGFPGDLAGQKLRHQAGPHQPPGPQAQLGVQPRKPRDFPQVARSRLREIRNRPHHRCP